MERRWLLRLGVNRQRQSKTHKHAQHCVAFHRIDLQQLLRHYKPHEHAFMVFATNYGTNHHIFARLIGRDHRKLLCARSKQQIPTGYL
jgi:hypothetical protein